jgi:hypothetical protein
MFIDTSHVRESENFTLPFSTSCDRCFNLGYRIHPQGGVEQCPVIQSSEPHPEISPAGKIIDRSIRLLIHRRLEVDQVHFDIARTLAAWSAEKPCTNDELVRRHFGYANGASEVNRQEAARRRVAKAVRFLREIWFLPVGSRKDKPSGYYICTTEPEFKEYFDRTRREPITELSMLHRMAAANWPVFAGQMEADFWTDMSPVREFLERTDAALEFTIEGEAIPYDVGTEGIHIE